LATHHDGIFTAQIEQQQGQQQQRQQQQKQQQNVRNEDS